MLASFVLWLVASADAADWRSAMATGDCAGVVAALPSPGGASPDGDYERLALARCLDLLGEDARAGELAAGVTHAPLQPYAKLVRARAMLDRDNPVEAAAVLEGVQLPGYEDELLRGRALVAAHRSLDARDRLRALLDVPSVAPEARYWLAFGAEDRGDREAAVAAYRALWTKHPMSPWSAKAEARLEKLGVPAPDYSTEDGRALALERAKALIAMKQAPEAIPLLDGIHGRDAFDTDSERLWFADALFDGKAYARARDQYLRAPGTHASSRSLFQYALATARAGDYTAAEGLYGELVGRYPDSAEADEASWKPGYMKHDAGDLVGAVHAFDVYLAARPQGRFAADARWFRAWDLHRLGKDIEAINAMEGLLSAYPKVELAIAARYWRAVLKGDRAGLEQVLSVYPDSGYAWFAANRLGKAFPKASEPSRPVMPSAWSSDGTSLGLGIALVQAGMADWGRPLLAGAASSAQGEAQAVALAWVLVDAEDYAGAKKLACSYKDSRQALAACLVRPHRAAVAEIAGQFGLDANLPYAIMNAESGLDPSVTSPAGAMGLMQLMPRLAEDLAKDRIAGFYPEQLYRAGINARLGTTELGLLQGRFGRSAVQPSLPLVIAGYNGGAEAVDRWLGTYTIAPDADEFAENISFAETRRYVRRVLGYLMQYRRAWGDG
jgi:soluble lytic murein transglycosylase